MRAIVPLLALLVPVASALAESPSELTRWRALRFSSLNLTDAERPARRGIFRFFPNLEYLVLAGDSRVVAGAGGGNAMLEFPAERAQPGRPDRGLQAGSSGPVSELPIQASSIPLDPSAGLALAFIAGSGRNPRTGALDAVGGAGITWSAEGFRNELMAGLFGSSEGALQLTQLVGWFVSERFAIRVFELPQGSLDFVVRGQLEENPFGVSAVGWAGFDLRTN